MDLLAKQLREKAEAAVATIKKRKLEEGRSEASAVGKTDGDGESKAEDATTGDAIGGASASNGTNGGGKGTKGSAPASAGKGGGAPGAKGKKGELEKLSQEKCNQLGAEVGEQQRKALLAERSGLPP